MADAAINSARMKVSSMDTQSESVLPAPEGDPTPFPVPADAEVVMPPGRPPVYAIVLMTVAAQIVLFVVVASLWPLERYETAPGVAEVVAPRVVVDTDGAENDDLEVQIFQPDEGPLFVTATTSELTGLQALMGWYDPTVDVRTCEEQYGTCDPAELRKVSLGAMSTAKQIAEYVALRRLGFDVALIPGPAQVGSFSRETCPGDAPPMRACKVLEVGDVFSVVDGRPVEVADDLIGVVDGRRPGDVIEVTVARPDDDPRVVEVELMAAPDDPDRTIIGFIPRDTRLVDVPLTVDIDTDRIGGPSAGLAFALTLIDLLSEGELVRGERVAVTGTIDDQARVGAIGALAQKAESVRRAGVTLFIVPSGQPASDLARAREIAGPDIDIVTVATLDDALALLAERGGDPLPDRVDR
jgi:Lon-like protease